MRNATIATLVTALVFGFAGCEHDPHGGDDHSHDFKPKHGGELIHLADHGPMIEVVHDEAAGTIKLFVAGPHQEVLKIEKAPVLNHTSKDGPKQLTAKGTGAEWTFTDDSLKGHVGDVAFRLEIGDKTFNKEWHPPH